MYEVRFRHWRMETLMTRQFHNLLGILVSEIRECTCTFVSRIVEERCKVEF